MKSTLKNQTGMSLTTMIALGFVAAVVVVFIIGLVAYLLNR